MKNKTGMILIGLPIVALLLVFFSLANLTGELHGAKQLNDILIEVACADPAQFEKVLSTIPIPDGEFSGPIKDNEALWATMRNNLLDKCD